MQKRRERRRTGAVKMSCIIAAVVFFVSACMLDSNTIAPFVICCTSLAWLGLVAVANDERKEELSQIKRGIRESANPTDADEK